MDTSWLNIAIPAAIIAAFILFKRMGRVKPARAHELVKGGAALVDVRSPMEFSSGHLPGALNMPLNELGTHLRKLGPKKDRPVVLYCASGTRSAMARSVLKGQGFTQVFNLGSMSNW